MAFVRHYGDHYTDAAGDHDWNAELLKRMNEEMEDKWQSFEDKTIKHGDDLQASFGHVIRKLRKGITYIFQLCDSSDHKNIDAQAGPLVLKTIKTEERDIKYRLEDEVFDLLKRIKCKALNPFHAFFANSTQ